MGRELVQQLFDAVPLPWTVHIRHPVLRQAAEILVNLREETSALISSGLLSRRHESKNNPVCFLRVLEVFE